MDSLEDALGALLGRGTEPSGTMGSSDSNDGSNEDALVGDTKEEVNNVEESIEGDTELGELTDTRVEVDSVLKGLDEDFTDSKLERGNEHCNVASGWRFLSFFRCLEEDMLNKKW